MTRTRSNHPWKFATYTDFVHVCRSDSLSLSLSQRGLTERGRALARLRSTLHCSHPSSKKNRSVSCAPLILRTATSLTVHRKVARSATRRLCITPPARAFAHHPSPTTASRPSRPRSRPRAHRASPSARVGTAAPLAAFTPREHAHAPSLELARGTDALRFVARVMIPPRARRRRVRARRSPQPYPPRINPSACVVYVCADTGRWCRIMMVCEGSTRDHVVGWVGVMSRDPSIESPVIRDGAMNAWER